MRDEAVEPQDDAESALATRRHALLGGAAALGCAACGCAYNEVIDRRQLAFVSPQRMAQLAASTWTQIKRTETVSRDPRAQARVREVGSRIVEATGGNPSQWEFQAFDSEELNAFALPGGRVGVYRGILDLASSDSELAGVVGHEVGHVYARHSSERFSQNVVAQVGLTAANIALAASDIRYSQAIAGVLGAGVTFGVILPFSRKHELEADILGVRYMHAARYDPYGAVLFWQKMLERQSSGRPPAFMSTHPEGDKRIAVIQREIRLLGV